MGLVFAGLVFLSSFFENGQYERFVREKIFGAQGATANMTETVSGVEAPKKFYFTKSWSQKPKVSAEAYLIGDLENGEIILEKNQSKQFPIASVSKLMTATVSKEFQNQEDLAQVSKTAIKTEGENGNFRLNEKIKIKDLLYPLLLESSNDAAEILAENSGRAYFLEKMNEKAEDIGLASTFFEDPSGLSPHNQSTVLDLFRLAKYVREKSADLFSITTNHSYKNGNHIWQSNNQFLREDGYIGGKSGYTDEALQTGVSLFSLPLGSSEDRNIAITLLYSRDRYRDVENILKYLKNNVFYGTEDEKGAAWVRQNTNALEEKEPDFVLLSFLGDIMLDRGVRSSVGKNFNGDYSKLFDKLTILKKSDIVFANLEGTASDKGDDGGSLYSFRMDPSVVPALRGAGINIVSVANNHIGDWGYTAFTDTLSRLKENEILYTGGGYNKEEAEKPAIIEKNDIKIGFLGFSDKGPAYMEAKSDKAGILLASDPNFDQIIKNAGAEVDYLIVSFHFGEEYEKTHNERQAELSHRAIDAGAKIVVGTHPHVIEDTEVYKGGYIFYSLGNFIFDQRFSKDTMEGMLAQVRLNKNGTMTVEKNIVQLSPYFQPDKIIKGKEEKVVFQEID